jgi:hypothetical protein
MTGKETSAPRALWHVLTQKSYEAARDRVRPKPFASPYVAGVVLGLVLFASFFITGRGLGASGAMNRLMAWLYSLASPRLAQSFSYYAEYLGDNGSILFDYSVFSLLGVFIGGYTSASLGRRSHLAIERGPRVSNRARLGYAFLGGVIMAQGARIARGCTSGQVLTGSANLAIGSLIMFGCFFAGGYLAAYVGRKQWI